MRRAIIALGLATQLACGGPSSEPLGGSCRVGAPSHLDAAPGDALRIDLDLPPIGSVDVDLPANWRVTTDDSGLTAYPPDDATGSYVIHLRARCAQINSQTEVYVTIDPDGEPADRGPLGPPPPRPAPPDGAPLPDLSLPDLSIFDTSARDETASLEIATLGDD